MRLTGPHAGSCQYLRKWSAMYKRVEKDGKIVMQTTGKQKRLKALYPKATP